MGMAATPKPKPKMKSIDELTTAEIELHQLRRAIAKTDADIIRCAADVERMRAKNLRRHIEILRQETIAAIKRRLP